MEKRLIDANALEKDMRAYADRKYANGHIETACGILSAICRIETAPTIYAVEVVRCKECKEYELDCGYCDYWEVSRNFDDYCSRGMRKMDAKE